MRKQLTRAQVHIGHVLAIDFPGCGRSEFAPKDPAAYTTAALCSLVASVVAQYREENQQVVFVGHSMGCSIVASLVTKGGLMEDVGAGFVAICPKATASDKEIKALKTAVAMPECVFDMFRLLDRRGGIKSASVNRFVASTASEHARKLQLKFNKQSKTPVWRRMVKGITLPSREEWTAIRCPILLIGATEDQVTTPAEVDMIHSWFDPAKRATSISSSDDSSVDSSAQLPHANVKKCVIPSAGHGVMYESPQVLCGLVGEFLSKHVDEVLSLAWQLLYLKEDKWLLKNLEKWNRLQSVSPRIVKKPKNGGKIVLSPFRAMKTLRQNDVHGHNPVAFSTTWTDVSDVIDISHEQPPYDPESFGAGVKYHKCMSLLASLSRTAADS